VRILIISPHPLRDPSHSSGVYAVVASFLTFSMIQFRDGPFIRPHPAFWRVVLGVNLLYELSLVFLLFQDLDSARRMMTIIDPNLGVPLPEKSYAENCELTPTVFWVSASPSEKRWFPYRLLGCVGYLLCRSCPRVVRQSHDLARLLVLLGARFTDRRRVFFLLLIFTC
jgi:hypothetical protein